MAEKAEKIMMRSTAQAHSFIASKYCSDIEVKQGMERHQKNEACIVPIILLRPPALLQGKCVFVLSRCESVRPRRDSTQAGNGSQRTVQVHPKRADRSAPAVEREQKPAVAAQREVDGAAARANVAGDA